jgi:hypothetical protein
MGPYGVHHDRSQTWWPMADAYHKYVTRCQFILQQGQTVADILYLNPEGAPQVFKAPSSALTKGIVPDKTLVFSVKGEIPPTDSKDAFLPDRKGYNFDGCSPSQLLKASVVDGKIVFPSGASYYLLVLPKTETMTPALLTKIESLVKEGAVIIGNPPSKSPSLVNYPECDKQIATISSSIWGGTTAPSKISERKVGKGKIYWGGDFSNFNLPELYPNYDATATILREMGIAEDFQSSGSVRYTHKLIPSGDIYFVSNKTNTALNATCSFRVSSGTPELWNPMTGETRKLPDFEVKKGQIQIPLQFDAFESYFIVFDKSSKAEPSNKAGLKNFTQPNVLFEVGNPWKVSFNPIWGGPEDIVFDKLVDWTSRPEEGIKYYSGIATYHKTIQLPENVVTDKNADLFLDLGEVNNIARVWVNGKDMGVVWTAPFRIKITDAIVSGENKIDIEVANLWPNRLIGDEKKPDDGIKDNQWPDWLLNGKPRTSGRYTFTTWKHYSKDSKLLKSGLIGPVRVITMK